MKLYVIRHGQTEWNVLKKMQGSLNIPLNERGMKQAQEIKSNLEDINFDIIFCSPLIRAKKQLKLLIVTGI